MTIQLFPKEEYWLNSPLTARAALDAINANVMERDFITFGLLSAIVDKKMRTYRYFEGSVGEMQFEINCKHYWSQRNNSIALPIIDGTIEQTGNTSSIHIVCGPPSRTYLLLSIPIIAIIVSTLILPKHAQPGMLLPFLIVYVLVIAISRYRYIRRLKKDKKHLMTIFDASESMLQH